MKRAALCFCIKEENGKISDVLLLKKKVGFSKDKWNGSGGIVKNENQDVDDYMYEETQKQTGIILKNYEKVAELNFVFPKKNEQSHLAHIYLCRKWEGEPKETDEAKPQWFKVEDIPYNDMFPADIFWLPKIMTGKLIKVIVVYDNDMTILDQVTDTVDKI